MDSNVYQPCPRKPIGLFHDIPITWEVFYPPFFVYFLFMELSTANKKKHENLVEARKMLRLSEKVANLTSESVISESSNFDLVTWLYLFNFRQGKVIEQDSVSIRIKPLFRLKDSKYCFKSSLQNP